MIEPTFFHSVFPIFLWSPLIVMSILLFSKIKAPYGKHTSSVWGLKTIDSKLGWILMEAPSVLIFLAYFVFFYKTVTLGQVALFIIWQSHYVYRSFIYPLKARHSKPMSLILMLAALSFQITNTYFQASWIFQYAPKDMYDTSLLTSWHFILGVIIFFVGTYINRTSDYILRSLRKPGETDYKIPYKGMYRFVSCPNYLGEMIIWLGWAVMLKSWVGVAFFFWTCSNLAPRAIATHKWYLNKFPDSYPNDRKALIPFIF